MPRPIWVTIDSGALTHNLGVVASALAGDGRAVDARIWAVTKAQAYGHGLDAAIRGFAQADGLAMLDLDEAVYCREHGWHGPLLLLEGFFEPDDLPVLARHRIAATVHCVEQLAMLEAARPVRPIDIFLKLNTGMYRLGFQAPEYRDIYRRAARLQAMGIVGVLGKMTHFACADEDARATQEQIACFQKVTEGLPGPVSLCNSAAVLTPELVGAVSAQTGDHWVRPGICLYGASPFAHRTAQGLGLRPAMTLAARLISTHPLPAGQSIGYGLTFRASRTMRVGIVACGYADGYPRHAGTGTPVVVDGVRTRLVGRVSMDMLAVDLGPVPQAQVGSLVVLWGQGGPSADEVALSCGTISYELLTAVTSRVPRHVLPVSEQEQR